MMRRRTTAASLLLVACVALAGCGTSGGGDVDQELDVERAKRVAMEMELELAALVPSENVASLDQQQEGVLVSCEGERAYQWTGQTTVALQGAPDTEAIVNSAVSEYSERDPYTARLETTADGYPSAHVRGPHSAGWLMTESVDGTSLEILSFSPCFRLPDDLYPGDRF
jgi:predicted small secreted protein